jgi:hypothetical protein
MSEVKVNKITPTTNCGTVTLGDSGDTIAIASGVTLSNSGSITNSGTITNTGTISGGTITGTIDNQVNWDTTAKTAGFTAVAGNGYFVNTTSGAITVTLPATPSAGDLVGIKDYANTANTNNITIDRNGEPIQGTANNFTISVAGTSITLIYVDGTQGWVSTGAAKASDITEQALFTIATGGTITCCGDYKIHTFTGPGTFCVSQIGNGPTNPTGGPTTVSYMVIAGGAYGGGQGGGGGAGGFREGRDIGPSYTASPLVAPTGLTITATAYPITVGAGGTNPSSFSTITSAGGGEGGGFSPGVSGGSGGGGSYGAPVNPPNVAGSGNTPPTSPPQGNPGGAGNGLSCGSWRGGGGGGAGGAGNAANPTNAGNGGNGITTSITASPVTYAGGGGGGTYIPGTRGTGGPGGGGNGAQHTPLVAGTNGSANTGGGGGGGSYITSPATIGGSGIVVIRYKYQ